MFAQLETDMECYLLFDKILTTTYLHAFVESEFGSKRVSCDPIGVRWWTGGRINRANQHRVYSSIRNYIG